MRIYKKGKTSLVSSILNILGLTAAFAALYIILVQVHHDLTYNKALKDSDRIYVLTKKEINQRLFLEAVGFKSHRLEEPQGGLHSPFSINRLALTAVHPDSGLQ